jgi:serine phosphatase RsbU (regulator of sigma subunit)/PAS domain-containing protein
VSAEAGSSAVEAIDARLALEFLAEASATLAASTAYEESLCEVTRLAVPSLADWCAVDLLEDDGSLRQFTSGHRDPEQERLLVELRRRYRDEKRSSEGVARVIATGRPELVSELGGESAIELRSEEHDLYVRLAPRSYMIVALNVDARTIGALTFLSTAPGRHYTQVDLAVIDQLANRIALAVEGARLRAEVERAYGLLDTLFSTAPVGLAFWDRELRCVRANAAYAAMSARTPEGFPGHTMRELFGELGAEREGYYREIMEAGEPRHGVEVSGPALDDPTELRNWALSCTPVRGADGEVIGLGVVAVDVTERQRALTAEREARARSSFLARAGEILDSSMDYETTLDNLARIMVPEIADWCSIQLVDENGVLRQVAVVHSEPERERWAWELNERYPTPQDSPRGPPNVVRTGRYELVNDITEDLLVEGAVDDEQLQLLHDLGLTSALCAPLQVRGRTLGALVLVSAESGKRFSPADVELAVDLGRRAGIAVENSRLYTGRSHIAHTLQSELLPSGLPDIPGFELAASYRAAGEMNEVGGDFLDIFETPRGRWAAFIGDVSGKGAEAAAATALARYTLRAAVLQPGEPHVALGLLNDALLGDRDRKQFATVCLVCFERATGVARGTVCLGGHPPPLLLRADGEVTASGAFGTLLGMTDDPRLIDEDLVLGPGDTLLLYTDGVVEAGEGSHRLGQDGLERRLAELRGRTPSDIVAAVELTAVEAQEGEPRDDMAMLALRFTG